MKKIFVVLLALCFVSGTFSSVFAQAPSHKKEHSGIQVIYGAVISVDKEKREIVVREEKTGENKTFQVGGSSALLVKTGQRVKLKIKTGSSVAESVKVAQSKAKNK